MKLKEAMNANRSIADKNQCFAIKSNIDEVLEHLRKLRIRIAESGCYKSMELISEAEKAEVILEKMYHTL